jgi:hypothetical protein
MLRSGDAQVRGKVERLIKIWEDRFVYAPQFCRALVERLGMN